MTPDFSPPPELTPGQLAHLKRLDEFGRREERERLAAVHFFAAILCTCRLWWDAEADGPPQLGCTVHGMLMIGNDGQILMPPGMNLPRRVFTPVHA